MNIANIYFSFLSFVANVRVSSLDEAPRWSVLDLRKEGGLLSLALGTAEQTLVVAFAMDRISAIAVLACETGERG